MSLTRHTQQLKAQIVDTKRMLEMVSKHPIMSYSMAMKLKTLEAELASLPDISYEPKMEVLFSGDAVRGSIGVKASFLGHALRPLQDLIKSQTAIVRFGKIAPRGQARKSSELFLTALPTGSFGVELTHFDSRDLMHSVNVSEAMKEVMSLIKKSSVDDNSFEEVASKMPMRNIKNLKKFLEEVAKEHSVLEMKSGETSVDLTREEVLEAYRRVAATVQEEEEIYINGTLRGLFLESEKFEIVDEAGKKISGNINEDIREDELAEYFKNYLNTEQKFHLSLHKTQFTKGKEKTEYELLQILPQENAADGIRQPQ